LWQVTQYFCKTGWKGEAGAATPRDTGEGGCCEGLAARRCGSRGDVPSHGSPRAATSQPRARSANNAATERPLNMTPPPLSQGALHYPTGSERAPHYPTGTKGEQYGSS